jgi:hypothetical protein
MALSNARKEKVYNYEKYEGLERRFCVNSIKTSIPRSSCARERPPLFLASMWIGHILRDRMIPSSIKQLQSARNLVSIISWAFVKIGMRGSLLNFTPLSTVMQGKLLSFR